ncbi:hypothetical protein KR032_010077, partial [Drosophila birchii]
LPAAILSLGQAAELPQTTETTTTNTAGGKQPLAQGQTELPVHIQNLITSHINQVLQHVKNKNSNTLTGAIGGTSSSSAGSSSSSTGSWAGSGSINGAPVVKPYPDLLPPLAHSGDVPPIAIVDRPASASAVQSGLQPVQAGHPQVRTVTNHQAIGTLIHQGRPVVQNKVVMPPVEQVVHQLEPIDVAEKLQKLQQHVAKVMQQAEKHIPLALQQAIQKKKEQQEQREKEELQKDKENEKEKEVAGEPKDTEHKPGKTGRALVIPPKVSNIVNQVHAHIPQLLAQHREEIQLGKCNFECPRQALNICASNGKCVVNFPGQCELSQWNCFNTKNVFHQVHDSECQNTITCYKKDMM